MYAYDAAGNVTEEKRADGSVVIYAYDDSNRLTGADYPGTDSDVTYTWDDDTVPSSGVVTDCRTSAAMSGPRLTAGRLSKVTDQSGTRWFNYDEHGRMMALWDMRNTLGESCARVSTWSCERSLSSS